MAFVCKEINSSMTCSLITYYTKHETVPDYSEMMLMFLKVRVIQCQCYFRLSDSITFMYLTFKKIISHVKQFR